MPFNDPPRWLCNALVVLRFVLAWLIYKLLERPVRMSRVARPAVVPIMVALAIAGSGFAIERGGGLPLRAANATGFAWPDLDPTFLKPFYEKTVSCTPAKENLEPSIQCQSLPGASPRIAVLGDSQTTCMFAVDAVQLGDTTNGCGKDFIANWRCGSDQKVHQFYLATEGAADRRCSAVRCRKGRRAPGRPD